MGCKPLNCHYKMGTQRGATEHSRDDKGGGGSSFYVIGPWVDDEAGMYTALVYSLPVFFHTVQPRLWIASLSKYLTNLNCDGRSRKV